MAKKLLHPRGIVFDIDGTLVDSNHYHALAWFEALQVHGYRVSLKEIERMIGMGGDKLLPLAAGIQSESADGKKIAASRGEIFQQRFMPVLKPFRGANALAKAFHERGLKMAVASSADPDELHKLVQIAGIRDYLESMPPEEDVPTKPDPDVIEVALKTLGLSTGDVVMVGDTPYDIEAASALAIPTIAFRCGGLWSDEDLKRAAKIFDDPQDCLENIDDVLHIPVGGGGRQ